MNRLSSIKNNVRICLQYIEHSMDIGRSYRIEYTRFSTSIYCFSFSSFFFVSISLRSLHSYCQLKKNTSHVLHLRIFHYHLNFNLLHGTNCFDTAFEFKTYNSKWFFCCCCCWFSTTYSPIYRSSSCPGTFSLLQRSFSDPPFSFTT